MKEERYFCPDCSMEVYQDAEHSIWECQGRCCQQRDQAQEVAWQLWEAAVGHNPKVAYELSRDHAWLPGQVEEP